MMPSIGKELGRILAQKMPNPKSGTVTPNIGNAVRDIKAGKVEYRLDKTGIVHTIVGKASFERGQLPRTSDTLLDAIVRAKPSAAKGTYLRSITLSSTMGPGVASTPRASSRRRRSRDRALVDHQRRAGVGAIPSFGEESGIAFGRLGVQLERRRHAPSAVELFDDGKVIAAERTLAACAQDVVEGGSGHVQGIATPHGEGAVIGRALVDVAISYVGGPERCSGGIGAHP
jgi:hypothetical protein